ncbi:MAG: type I methionyl aminopeptidase [Clostridia bacterium]|nr:type I methionyl aminopeptidase [Clostridia bacterium]MBQ4098256.1 type I methionyl aminopeptidase [Clostridia bacterium]
MIIIKTDREIELMREPCKVVRDVLLLAGQTVKAGMTTGELDKILHDYITSCGAKPSFLGLYGFPKSTCISINEEVVHGIPGNRVIKDGDIVSVDVGACLNGFHGDGARTFCIGSVTPEKEKLVRVTEECFFKGIEGIMIGSALGDIGAQVEEHAVKNGFSVVKAMVGHGIGRQVHEDPEVPNYGRRGVGVRLRRNMALAIEPMINMGTYQVDIDGWDCITRDKMPSAHYENTVVITDNGVEILTL